RDFLNLEIDGASFPPADDANYGFDNIADTLLLTPPLLERYILTAKKISRLAVGDRNLRPSLTSYTAAPLRIQDARMSDDLRAGSRGGFVVTHYFPVDGEYVLRIELQRNPTNGIVRGRADHNLVDVRIDGVRLKTFDMPPGGGAVYGAEDESDKDL